jgi:hypothetical protein
MPHVTRISIKFVLLLHSTYEESTYFNNQSIALHGQPQIMSVEEKDTDNIGEGEVSESSIAALREKLAQYAHSPSPRSRLSKTSSSNTRCA